MTRMTGGQALVKSIIANGVDTIFGLPGVQLDWFFNALHDEGNNIRVMNARHEQGVAYMANGYAQSTGKVGAFAVVPGPGVLNTTAALSTAYAVNAPVLCVTGQIPSVHIGRDLGMLHEIPDQLGTLKGLTKWAERIDHSTDAPGKVNEAFRQLRSGRPRPVAIEMPLDQLAQSAAVELLPAAEGDPAPPVDDDAINAAADLLAEAKSPMIVVGGGVIGAEEELQELAEMLQSPVVANRNGRGALSDRHYLSCTMPTGYRLWPDTDVVLGVGTRMQPHRMNWVHPGGLKVIHVDIDPTELKRVGSPTVGICGAAKSTLAALIEALNRRAPKRASREEEMVALKGEVMAMLEDKLTPQMAWIRAIRAALDDDAIIVDELTQVGYVSRMAMPVYQSRTFLGSGYQGTLGAGFATAIGVKVANPDRQVLSVNGDGGFMYTASELATAVQYNIPLVAVVFADGAYGNVKRMQKNDYDGRMIASDLRNPDFVAFAESFGAVGMRADTPEQLTQTIGEAFRQNAPVIIETPLGDTPDPWGLVYPKAVRPEKAKS
jgi:acetolactate synthase-1/2/3 large subunit